MQALSDAFRVLGDETRLRILKLVGQAPLNVSELVSVVGVAQSSVSHHLGKLKALELIREERTGGYTYYSLAVGEDDERWPLIRLARGGADEHGDGARLEELLRRREDRATLNERLLEPGQSWPLWSAALASLLPKLDVLDFGCGTGVLTVELARWAKKVTAIDRSETALAQARTRVAREGLKNVRFIEADLQALPLAAGKADLVVLSQSLHFVNDAASVLREAARLLKPSGRVIVLELMPHGERWVLERLGHVTLGFEPPALRLVVEQAGFRQVHFFDAPRDGAHAFRPFLLTGTKP